MGGLPLATWPGVRVPQELCDGRSGCVLGSAGSVVCSFPIF